MKITEAWLDEHIFSDPDCGGYQLSRKQQELLCMWFPDLFKDGAGGEKNLTSGWNKSLLGREISESRSQVFGRANARKSIQKKKRSKIITKFINEGLAICNNIYGSKPEHPHENFVRKIGMVSGVCIQAVLFKPENDTAVEFMLEGDERGRRYRAECTGEYNRKKAMYGLNSAIYEIFGENPLDEGRKRILISDCSGSDIKKEIRRLKPETRPARKMWIKRNG